MADLPETPQWEAGIYQLELTDPVVAGPPDLAQGLGMSNVSPQQLANRTAWLKAQIEAAAANLAAAYAPLASPSLTGNPTAPTQASGNDTTRLATTAFVQAALAAMVAAAPGTLDTLNELAAALGDDPNFATTITNALALKANAADLAVGATAAKASTAEAQAGADDNDFMTALKVAQAIAAIAHAHTLADISDAGTMAGETASEYAKLASPGLTGNPTAPTQGAGNNSTRIASTAFVQAALAAMVAAAPGTLDTLNELAAALGDDPNFATTMTNALAGKANSADLAAGATAAKASTAEALAGLDDTRFMTPLKTAQAITGIGLAFAAATVGPVTTIDLSSAVLNFTVLLNQNITLTFSNTSPGQTGLIEFTQDATGGRTVAYAAAVCAFSGGASYAPDVSAAAAAKDVLAYAVLSNGRVFLQLARDVKL